MQESLYVRTSREKEMIGSKEKMKKRFIALMIMIIMLTGMVETVHAE